MLTVYGLAHCTTTQKAIKTLEENGIKIKELIDIRETPPTKETIILAIQSQNGNIKKIMNTSGNLYKEMGLKDKLDSMTEDEIIQLLTQHGMLIKRPLITDFHKASVSARNNILEETWIHS
ncbi:Spx/MgsR family RNA polymerase-binding regulatory protein [Aerococcaceae bacterium WGS1372]